MDHPSPSARPINGTTQPPEPPREVTFEASDGVKLGGVLARPAGEPRGVIVILGAMAVASRYYRHFAEHLASAGWVTLRFDYRGVGLSRRRSLRGDPTTLDDWVDRDTEAALDYIRDRYADLPLVLVGHSLGGQTIGLTSAASRVDALVVVSAGSGWLGNWPPLQRLRLQAVMGALIPAVSRVAGYIPGWLGLGEDLPAGVAMQWRRWCLTPGYLTGAVDRSRLHYHDVDAPLLMWSFTDDDYAPARSTQQMLSWYANASIEQRRLSPEDTGRKTGHFGFFRPPSSALWEQTLQWLHDRLSIG
jgi:predicted alpha/beta hydrolase